MENARLFIRNDDVWMLDPSFRFFFDQAISRNLPIIYAVIPGKMEKGLIRFLRRAKERKPHLLDIVQHGWLHVDHSTGDVEKYEFGASRSLKLQRENIQQGVRKMCLAFGDGFTPAFVPPFHGYDERTLRILQEEGFQIFSAGNSKLKKESGLLELPANISFSRYGKGRVSTNTAMDVVEMLIKDICRVPLSGIVTHHVDFITAVSRKELTRFFDLIETLRSRKKLRVLLFSELSLGLNSLHEYHRDLSI